MTFSIEWVLATMVIFILAMLTIAWLASENQKLANQVTTLSTGYLDLLKENERLAKQLEDL